MAVHGVKVNNKELQKVLDNELAKQIRKAASAGKKAMDELSANGVDEWYATVNAAHSYSSIPNSIMVEKGPIKQNSKEVWCDITMYVDEGRYLDLTEDVYSIYGWADRHKKSHPWASSFVLGLQWNDNVVGLPSPWSHISGDESLHDFMKQYLQLNWEETVNKYS